MSMRKVIKNYAGKDLVKYVKNFLTQKTFLLSK